MVVFKNCKFCNEVKQIKGFGYCASCYATEFNIEQIKGATIFQSYIYK